MMWGLALVALAAGAIYGRSRRHRGSRAASVAWPLPEWGPSKVRPWSGDRGLGADRDDHYHAGVDIGPWGDGAYGTPVAAVLPGVVEVVGGGFRGEDAKRIEIVSPGGTRIVYGAVQERAAVSVGDVVAAGQIIGWLGRYPGGSVMLHLEEHRGPRERWLLGEPRPATLVDPALSSLRSFR